MLFMERVMNKAMVMAMIKITFISSMDLREREGGVWLIEKMALIRLGFLEERARAVACGREDLGVYSRTRGEGLTRIKWYRRREAFWDVQRVLEF